MSERFREPRDANRKKFLRVYASFNVGRERWCLLTTKFTTLKHVLKNNNDNMYLLGQNKHSIKIVVHSCCRLVPRLLPSKIDTRPCLDKRYGPSRNDAANTSLHSRTATPRHFSTS
ncbi:hypothetical protein Pmani_030754 [Petrolisthes manimaculis]|uniref:Uncharacterized protein n=1 Tax=Petrolisthes manimaculis TaxID=1843537 RepID=A0AAE1TTA1_9EUCA|nr:hypothetical protein Pmani_030754 [Petrolisthes manimaculis]